MSTERAQVVDPWLTRDEVAAELQVSTRTVDRYITDGILDASKLPGGRLVRIRRSELVKITEPIHSSLAAVPPSGEGTPFPGVSDPTTGDPDAA